MKLNHLKESDIILKPNKIIFKGEKPTCKEGMLLIYADWCGHCVRFKPTYEYLTDIFNKLYKSGNCALNKNESIKSEKGKAPLFWAIQHDDNRSDIKFVKGYPSIYIVRDIDNGEGALEPCEGGRDIEDLLQKFKLDVQYKKSNK